MSIDVGTIMVREGACFPESLGVASEAYSRRWRLYSGMKTPAALDRSIRTQGWSFFYLGEQHSAFAFGSVGESGVRKALNRLLRNAEPDAFNCIEVTGIAARRFLGLSIVMVYGHSRHIQRSGDLESDVVRSKAIRR